MLKPTQLKRGILISFAFIYDVLCPMDTVHVSVVDIVVIDFFVKTTTPVVRKNKGRRGKCRRRPNKFGTPVI